MASSIDPTKPTQGQATTQSVRDNFSAAKSEIEAEQSRNDTQDSRLAALESAPPPAAAIIVQDDGAGDVQATTLNFAANIDVADQGGGVVDISAQAGAGVATYLWCRVDASEGLIFDGSPELSLVKVGTGNFNINIDPALPDGGTPVQITGANNTPGFFNLASSSASTAQILAWDQNGVAADIDFNVVFLR